MPQRSPGVVSYEPAVVLLPMYTSVTRGCALRVSASQFSLLRFGVFELNLRTGELRKAGTIAFPRAQARVLYSEKTLAARRRATRFLDAIHYP